MIVLAPMSEAEFAAYVTEAVPDYARDKVRSGQWSQDESLCLSQEGFDELLPQGLATADNHLFTIRDSAERTAVGVLWFAVQERAGQRIAYVYDILIHPRFQRRGHATRAFAALEAKVGALGLSGIALHVFGHNTAAQALYCKLGYEPTNLSMFKKVGREGA